jgi:acetoin utilization deacetylase AcuC-like enzyme
MTDIPKGELRADPSKLKSRQFIHRNFPSGQPEKTKSSDQLKRESEQEDFIRAYNINYRPESLTEIHKREYAVKVKSGDKDDDISVKRFDWERDMNKGIKGGSAKDTSELMSRFGSISNRFSSGTSTKKFL